MKSLAVIMIVISSVLTGCVVAEPPYRGNSRGEYRGDRDRDGVPNRADRDRDRDGDGVPNRQDHRPDNPYRY